MNRFENPFWEELTRPGRWAESLRPAMAELEARLPGMLEPDIWLHRNVSVSDLERIGETAVRPPSGGPWPLLYLVCHFRKALLGVQLVERKQQDTWRTESRILEGTPCFCYAIDTEDPAADLESVLDDICEEVQRVKKRQKPLWRCKSDPVHMDREGKCLLERGLVKEEAGGWRVTERGEACGLMMLFTAGRAPQVRWSPSTWKALTAGSEDGAIPFQTRLQRLEQGIASCDAYAAKAVLQLAEMPLEDYFRSCPEVGPQDLCNLRKALSLPDACPFQTAAAALCRRLRQSPDTEEQSRLQTLLALLAMPIAKMSEWEKKSVLKNHRKREGFA